MKNDNIRTVEAYLDALKKRDLSIAPLAEDIRFESPIAGSGQGAEDFKAWLSGFLLALDDVRVLQHVSEGEYVVTNWEVDSAFGTVRILEKFRVRDGKIIEAVAYFDPRPVFGSQ